MCTGHSHIAKLFSPPVGLHCLLTLVSNIAMDYSPHGPDLVARTWAAFHP